MQMEIKKIPNLLRYLRTPYSLSTAELSNPFNIRNSKVTYFLCFKPSKSFSQSLNTSTYEDTSSSFLLALSICIKIVSTSLSLINETLIYHWIIMSYSDSYFIYQYVLFANIKITSYTQ